jgi:hypothetical protein
MSVTTKEPELQTFTVIRSHECEHGSGLFRFSGDSCGPLAKVVKSRAAVYRRQATRTVTCDYVRLCAIMCDCL